MLKNVEKISRILLQPSRQLMLRLHVKLVKEKDGRKENFHQAFSYGQKHYLKLDLQSFVTLEMTNTEWAKDKSILIDQRNIFQIIQAFEKTLEGIYKGGVFAVDTKGDVVVYADMQEKHTVRAFNIGSNQRLILKPSKIYDENEVSYEGVVMFINNTSNYVELPIDAFESLYYAIKQLDLFVYSQMLLNYYVSALEKEEALKTEDKDTKSKSTRSSKKHPLLVTPEEKEFVKSNTIIPVTPQEFFGIEQTETEDKK